MKDFKWSDYYKTPFGYANYLKEQKDKIKKDTAEIQEGFDSDINLEGADMSELEAIPNANQLFLILGYERAENDSEIIYSMDEIIITFNKEAKDVQFQNIENISESLSEAINKQLLEMRGE